MNFDILNTDACISKTMDLSKSQLLIVPLISRILGYIEVFKQTHLVVYYACLSDIEHYASFKWLLSRNGIVLAL